MVSASDPNYDPAQDPGNPAQTPSYKTPAFWMSLAAMAIGILTSSGLLADGSHLAKIVGVVASILGALGYTVHSAMATSSGNKGSAFVAAAKVQGAAIVEASKQNPS